jgi:endo-1,4-beta-xylanase
MDPVSDSSHTLAGIRAPTVVFYSGRYHVYATIWDTAQKANIQHASFVDWANASSATVDFLDNNAAFGAGRSQPQLFYFAAKSTWYLISQSGGPGYSTNSDPGQALKWSKTTNFYASTPKIVTDNAGSGGVGWTDFWVICDSANCHLFFTNTLGYLFRAQTTVGNFPNGFGDPVKLTQNSALLDGSRVYKVKGSTKYLLLVEGNGSGGRYIGAWSADALDGDWTKWTALANTEANSFAGHANITFAGTIWTWDVSTGELIRDTYDETMTIDPCNMRYFYAGKDHFAATKPDALMPWKLGLLVRSK